MFQLCRSIGEKWGRLKGTVSPPQNVFKSQHNNNYFKRFTYNNIIEDKFLATLKNVHNFRLRVLDLGTSIVTSCLLCSYNIVIGSIVTV